MAYFIITIARPQRSDAATQGIELYSIILVGIQ
jgi:hypothetical protein